MGRKRLGKELKLRPIRLDEDVWAEVQRLGKEYPTINEGLRVKLLGQVSELATKAIVEHYEKTVDEGGIAAEAVQEAARQVLYGQEPSEGLPDVRPRHPRYSVKPRPFKSPLLKPSEKGKK